jgi:hypothetical protein
VKPKLRHIFWNIFGWPDLPPKDFKPQNAINKYTGKEYQPLYNTMALLYLDGVTVYEIAEIYNVTRERVRQCVWKSYRASIDPRRLKDLNG